MLRFALISVSRTHTHALNESGISVDIVQGRTCEISGEHIAPNISPRFDAVKEKIGHTQQKIINQQSLNFGSF